MSWSLELKDSYYFTLRTSNLRIMANSKVLKNRSNHPSYVLQKHSWPLFWILQINRWTARGFQDVSLLPTAIFACKTIPETLHASSWKLTGQLPLLCTCFWGLFDRSTVLYPWLESRNWTSENNFSWRNICWWLWWQRRSCPCRFPFAVPVIDYFLQTWESTAVIRRLLLESQFTGGGLGIRV